MRDGHRGGTDFRETVYKTRFVSGNGGRMTRRFSLLQSSVESSEEGRFERVVDGRHRGMKGWLRFTILYGAIAYVTLVMVMIAIRFILE